MRKINGAGYALRLSGIELVGGGQSTAKLAALHSSIKAVLVGVKVDKILDKLKGISMDDTVTDEERAQLSATWAQIQSVYSSLAQQSADLGFTDEGSARYGAWIAAKTAFDNLSAVLAPILAGSGDQIVDGGALYEAFQKFYQASGILWQAISSELYDQEYKIVMSLDSHEFLYNGRGKPVDPSASISVKVKTTGIVGPVILSYNGQDHTLVDGSYVIPISDMEGKTQILVTATATDSQTKKSYSATALIVKRVSQPARPILVNDGNYTIGNPPATTREGALIEGDYFLDKDTNIPYSYIDGSWIPTTSSVGNWYDVLRDTLPIAISSDKTITSGSFIYAWIQMLAADSAFIKNLFAQEIELGQNESGGGGRIFSHNYLTSNGKEGWLLDYNGNGVFRNVFFSGVRMIDGSININNKDGKRVLETVDKTAKTTFQVSAKATHYLSDDIFAQLSVGELVEADVVVEGKAGTGYVVSNGQEIFRGSGDFTATAEGALSRGSGDEDEYLVTYYTKLSFTAPFAGKFIVSGKSLDCRTNSSATNSKFGLTAEERDYQQVIVAAQGETITWKSTHGYDFHWRNDNAVSGHYNSYHAFRGSKTLPAAYASCSYKCVLPVDTQNMRLHVFREDLAGGADKTSIVSGQYLESAAHPLTIGAVDCKDYAWYIDGRAYISSIPKGRYRLLGGSTVKITGSDNYDVDGMLSSYSMIAEELNLIVSDGLTIGLNLNGYLKMTTLVVNASYEINASGLYAETMSAGNFLGQIAKFCWKDNPLPGWLACDGTQPINSHYPLYNVIKNKGSDGFEYNEESDYYTITTGDANTYIYAGIPDL